MLFTIRAVFYNEIFNHHFIGIIGLGGAIKRRLSLRWGTGSRDLMIYDVFSNHVFPSGIK